MSKDAERQERKRKRLEKQQVWATPEDSMVFIHVQGKSANDENSYSAFVPARCITPDEMYWLRLAHFHNGDVHYRTEGKKDNENLAWALVLAMLEQDDRGIAQDHQVFGYKADEFKNATLDSLKNVDLTEKICKWKWYVHKTKDIHAREQHHISDVFILLNNYD